MESTSVTRAGEFTPCYTFDEMDLPDDLLRGIYAYGFERPSDVQEHVIRPMVQGQDIVGRAESGTGKTATILIATLARIDTNLLACQALVLTPTRELALATQGLARGIGHYLQQLRCYACIGGTSFRTDVDHLRQGQHLVVGTPGRVLDMMRRGHLGMEHLKVFVLDAADEVLARGFEDQILDIMKGLKLEVQLCLFSGTLPQDLVHLTERFLANPVRFLGTRGDPSVEGIRQYYVVVEDEDSKLEVFTGLFERLMITQGIIYCNTQLKADALAQSLKAHGFRVSMVHAGLEQEERRLAIREYCSGSSRVLISTDLLAHVDVQSVTLTINYDLPQKMNDYAYRIGRSGRFGRKGVAINLVTRQAIQAVHDIEQHYNAHMEELPAESPDFFGPSPLV